MGAEVRCDMPCHLFDPLRCAAAAQLTVRTLSNDLRHLKQPIRRSVGDQEMTAADVSTDRRLTGEERG